MSHPAAVVPAIAFERLVENLSSGPAGTGALSANVSRIAWVLPDAVETCRSDIFLALGATARLIETFAIEARVTRSEVARNLASTLSRKQLIALQFAVAVPSLWGDDLDDAWRAQIVNGAKPARWNSQLRLAWRIVVDGMPPRLEDLAPLFQSDPDGLFVATLLHAGPVTPARIAASLSEHLRASGATASERLSQLARHWRAAGLPQLPVLVVEKLMPHAACHIYLSGDVRGTLIDVVTAGTRPSGAQPEWSTCFDTLDSIDDFTPPNIATLHLSDRELAAFAPRNLPHGLLHSILLLLLPKRVWKDRAESQRAWATLHAFLSIEPELRHRVLTGLQVTRRRLLLNVLGADGVATLYKNAQSSPEERIQFLARARPLDTSQLREVLSNNPRWLSDLPATSVAQFADLAAEDALILAIAVHGDAISFRSIFRASAQQIWTALRGASEEDARRMLLSLANSPAAIRWLLRHSDEEQRQTFLTYLAKIADSDFASTLMRWEVLLRAIIPSVKSVELLKLRQLSGAAYLRLVDTVASIKPSWSVQLLSLRHSATGQVLWHRLLRERAQSGFDGTRGLPPLLLDAVLGSDAALGEAARERPDLFGDEALGRLPLTTLLRHAFVSFALGQWLDERLAPDVRLKHVDWVQKTYARTPTRGAAYELALRCSLADAHLLVRLAKKVALEAVGRPAEPGRALDAVYALHLLPKRSGGVRTITAPCAPLKRIQRRLLDTLFAHVPIHSAATGFRSGYSTVMNAERHVGKRLVVNVDVEACFPSIRYTEILRACRIAAGQELSPRAVHLLAALCSFNGALPTGAPTSPALLNIIMRRADGAITSSAARFGIAYSRYADDLTFSGDGDVHRIIPFVERVIGEVGLKIAEHKVNLFRRGRRQVVTGLVVNEKPNMPRRLRRRLRAAVHARTHERTPEWHGKHLSDAALLGHIANLATVQPREARELAEQVKTSRLSSAPRNGLDDAALGLLPAAPDA